MPLSLEKLRGILVSDKHIDGVDFDRITSEALKKMSL